MYIWASMTKVLSKLSIIVIQVHGKQHKELFITICWFHWDNLIGSSGEKLKVKSAFIEKIRLVIQVYGKLQLHEELFISKCSFHWDN